MENYFPHAEVKGQLTGPLQNGYQGDITIDYPSLDKATSAENATGPLLLKILGELKKLQQKMSKLETQQIELLNTTAKQNVMLQQLMKSGQQKQKANHVFPLQSVEMLQTLENDLNHKFDEMLQSIRQIIGDSTLSKRLESFFAKDLIMKLNYDGTQGKIALKNFKNIYCVFFEALRSTINTHEEFQKELRLGIKLIKNRTHKAKSVLRKNQHQNNQN